MGRRGVEGGGGGEESLETLDSVIIKLWVKHEDEERRKRERKKERSKKDSDKNTAKRTNHLVLKRNKFNPIQFTSA